MELYNGGTIPLAQFASMEKDNDILVNIIVKKQPLNSVYLSQRNNSTDFPVLTCAAALIDGKARTVIGARPGKAMIVDAAEHVPTDKNMRASKEYRSLLVKVLTRRAWEEIGGRAE